MRHKTRSKSRAELAEKLWQTGWSRCRRTCSSSRKRNHIASGCCTSLNSSGPISHTTSYENAKSWLWFWSKQALLNTSYSTTSKFDTWTTSNSGSTNSISFWRTTLENWAPKAMATNWTNKTSKQAQCKCTRNQNTINISWLSRPSLPLRDKSN